MFSHCYELYRVSRRLHVLGNGVRGKAESVFTRGTGSGGAAGAGKASRRLGESLSVGATSARRSIAGDMAAWTGRTRTLLMRAWIRPLVVG